MKTAYDIIIKPVITEQSMEATEDKKYAVSYTHLDVYKRQWSS